MKKCNTRNFGIAVVSFRFDGNYFSTYLYWFIGMEGAYDAMGSGEVEEQWAREHHSIWVEEIMAEKGIAPVTSCIRKRLLRRQAPSKKGPRKAVHLRKACT